MHKDQRGEAEKERGVTLGVMQPYFFPYIGYFQYIHACSDFIFYDDVQYIMRGWINRNYVLMNNEPLLITVPLNKASPNRTIGQTEIAKSAWQKKLLKTMEHAYLKAPYWKVVFPLIERVLMKGHTTISELAKDSIVTVCDYVCVQTRFERSSSIYGNAEMGRNQRLIDLCSRMNARDCIVPAGGKELYGKEEFAQHGIQLHYLKADLQPYSQGSSQSFKPSLSIIDVLMWNSVPQVQELIRRHTLD